MIQELVNKITEAEKQADEMIAAAMEESKAANYNAQIEAAKILADTKAKIKQERKKAIDDAEALAEEKFDAILKTGEEEAIKIVSKIDIKKEAVAVTEAYCKLY